MSSVTIYHNPQCGTSRKTLALIRDSGVEPRIVEYLKEPPDRASLRQLIAASGLSVHEVLRAKEPICEALGLHEAARSDEELLDAMLSHPVLINRPIVVTPRGTRLCRPAEIVLDILAPAARGPLSTEDGPAVVDAEGRRRA